MHTPELYEIRIASHLSESGVGRFEGLSVQLDPGGETVLRGALDQAALHGVLIRIRDLGLKLISVHLVGDHTADVERPPQSTDSAQEDAEFPLGSSHLPRLYDRFSK